MYNVHCTTFIYLFYYEIKARHIREERNVEGDMIVQSAVEVDPGGSAKILSNYVFNHQIARMK